MRPLYQYIACILAKLSLSDEAKEKAKEDMQKMLDYVEKLDELKRLKKYATAPQARSL